MFSIVTVGLLIVVAVLVTVIILRPPATTTAPPPPQATASPAGATTTTTPPTSTAASSTTIPPPVALSTVPPPPQAWTQAWTQLKRLTMPPTISESIGYWADLDIPKVERGSNHFSDLYYDYTGLRNGSDKTLMGTGPATLPAPEDCFSAAQTLAVGKIEPKDMVPGTTAWCIITKQGNLVWLHLLSGGGSLGNQQQPTLTFELMQWKKTS